MDRGTTFTITIPSRHPVRRSTTLRDDVRLSRLVRIGREPCGSIAAMAEEKGSASSNDPSDGPASRRSSAAIRPDMPSRRHCPSSTLVFVLEILNALNFDFGFWPNVGFLAGGIAISLGMIAPSTWRVDTVPLGTSAGRRRRRCSCSCWCPRCFRSSSGDRGQCGRHVDRQHALLGLVYLVLGFGAVSILEWAVRRFVSLFAASLSVLVRALSLLLFFLLVIFFTTETWQIWTVPGAEVRRGGRIVRALGRRIPFLAAPPERPRTRGRPPGRTPQPDRSA